MAAEDRIEAPLSPSTLDALRYALALFFVATALLWSFILHPLLANSFLFFFLAAVMASGWFGRGGPGLFAAIISAFAVDYFFFPPVRTLRIELEAVPYFLSFVLSAVVASWLSAERRREQERREAHLDELFEQAPEAIMLLDLQGRVTKVNREFTRMFGYARDEAISRRRSELIVPVELQEQAQQSGQWLACGESVNVETLCRRKNGALFPVSELAVPIIVADQRIADYVIFRDITESKRAAEALERSQAELAHLSRVTTMGELAASIAHEVNQPIAGIASSASAAMRWLAQSPPETQEAEEAMRNVIEDANRAASVLRRIRSFLEKNPPERVRTDLNDVIRAVLSLTDRQLRTANVVLRAELASDLPAVLGDRVQLQQVLLNLILNSVEAMATVTDRPRELFIRSCADAEGVLVQIRDSGSGLDENSRRRLFEPFFTTKSQGMGLGLSISRSIVEAHGGTLWAGESAAPGTEFRFILPPMENSE